MKPKLFCGSDLKPNFHFNKYHNMISVESVDSIVVEPDSAGAGLFVLEPEPVNMSRLRAVAV